MDSVCNELIDNFEKYLKRELKSHKKEIQEIERQLNEIEKYRQLKANGSIGLALSTVNDLTSVGAVGQTLNRTDGRRDSGLDDTTHANISSISGTSSSAVKSPVKTPKLMDTYVLNSAKQFFVMAETSNEKNEIICRLFHCRKLTKCVIYCKSLDIVESVTQVLLQEGVKVENLIGKNSKQRQKIVNKMNLNEIKFEAFVTARAIDNLMNIKQYVNYDLPGREAYIKKVGSKSETCPQYVVINTVTTHEYKQLLNYEKHYNTKITALDFKTKN